VLITFITHFSWKASCERGRRKRPLWKRRYAPISDKFLLGSFSAWQPLGAILSHPTSLFLLGHLGVYRETPAPPAQPSCSRQSMETHCKEQSLWTTCNTELAVASLRKSLRSCLLV